jgi:S-adenosylmethionine synthetase
MTIKKVNGLENILIKPLKQVALFEQQMEICERKGLGHPDTICDSIMNQASIELSKEYLKRFGTVLHHNLDKGLLTAGGAQVEFGGGKISSPILIVYGDRATFEVGGELVPVNEIAIRSTKEWLRRNLRFVEPDEHVRYQPEIKPGAASLQDIFHRKGEYLGANDTSAAVGFAPYSPTERVILDLERHLNSPGFKKDHPESGEDIKIMGSRNGRALNLTVAMAFIDRFVQSEADYFRKKSEIVEAMNDFINSRYSFDKVNVGLNVLDARGRGKDGLFLTVLGTSADVGDSGQVVGETTSSVSSPSTAPCRQKQRRGKIP